MGPSRARATALSPAPTPGLGACPRCGTAYGPLPPVATSFFDGLALRRCAHCGTRGGVVGETEHLLFSCESCGLPFLAGELLPRDRQICERCRTDAHPPDLPDALLAAATGEELRRALSGVWRFVGSPTVDGYLQRVARTVARRLEGAPEEIVVAVFDEPALRTLALPPRCVLVSTGMLASLDDEAELAFVLGHEIAHVACEDAAVRLARAGLHVAERDARLEVDTWARAASDLVRLGYGRRRERDADLRSVAALAAAGYEPASAVRWLARIGERVERGDAHVVELALAHPPAADRARRIERWLYGRLTAGLPGRTNREPHRRALGGDALERLAPARPLDPAPAPRAVGSDRRLWIVALLALVALAVLLLAVV